MVPEVNPEDLDVITKGIVANPNCTTMVAMPVLKPLHDEAGLTGLVVTTFQAVSGGGREGVAELAHQLKESAEYAEALALDGRAVRVSPAVKFPSTIANNVLPMAGKLLDDGKRAAFQVKKGDEVIFASYAGTEIKVDGEELLILSEDEVLAILE